MPPKWAPLRALAAQADPINRSRHQICGTQATIERWGIRFSRWRWGSLLQLFRGAHRLAGKKPEVIDQWAASERGASLFSTLGATPELAAAAVGQGNRRAVRARRLLYLVILALLCTNAALVAHDRERVLGQARLGNTNLARSVSERVESSIAEVDHVLDALVFELERSTLTAAGLAAMQPILVNHVARTEQIRGLFVYDASGAWIATSVPSWTSALNNSDRPYFLHHRNSTSTAALLGPPILSRSSGRWVLPLSRRLSDEDGNFAGVALATIELGHIRALLDRFDLGEGAITLIAADHYMTRRPLISEDVGKAATAVLAVLDEGDAGGGDVVSPIDGVTRLFSFEKTRNYPVKVIVAASKREVLRGWWVTSTWQTLWMLVLCFVLKRGNDYTRQAMRHRREAEASIRKAHTELAQANMSLQRMAQFDELTGLPNRRYFDRRLARAFKQAQRDQLPLSIVMIDVDEFKKYNDRYGHGEGDRCLRGVAEALQTAMRRPEDLIARYGGEEIVLLLPDTDSTGAAAVAEAARAAVRRARTVHAASAIGWVSVSLGVSTCVPGLRDQASEQLKRADDALYLAKEQGRDRVCVAA